MFNKSTINTFVFRQKIILTIVLLGAATCVHLLSSYSEWIDNQYAGIIYPGLSQVMRRLTGWFSFSLGDLIYGFLGAALLFTIFKGFIQIKKDKNQFKAWISHFLWNALILALAIYILFSLLWGYNYNRKGIAAQIGIQTASYNEKDLQIINSLLLDSLNLAQKKLMSSGLEKNVTINDLQRMTEKSFYDISVKYPFLKYKGRSIKRSLWSELGNYMGFSGYYNPFTGEAQINTEIPGFLLPFTACHEVAHQLGYAKENEANFVAYLTASSSQDLRLKYATYFELFLYANRNLFMLDSNEAKQYRNSLNLGVQSDIKELIRFSKEHENFVEPFVTKLYSVFLKQNEQPQGMLSYDQVNGLLIAYYKKFGKI